MGRRIRSQKYTVLDAKGATGVGANIDVGSYKDVIVAVIGASSANLTVKCCGSMYHARDIAFGTAASATNPHDFVAMYDLEDASLVDGDTGVAFTGSNDVRQFKINTDAMETINFNVTAWVAGSVTVYLWGATA